jgi:hypothetical protein
MENDRPILGDNRDLRAGAYDRVNDLGKLQPHPIRQAMTPHQAAQPGADVRPDPLPSRDDVCFRNVCAGTARTAQFSARPWQLTDLHNERLRTAAD